MNVAAYIPIEGRGKERIKRTVSGVLKCHGSYIEGQGTENHPLHGPRPEGNVVRDFNLSLSGG